MLFICLLMGSGAIGSPKTYNNQKKPSSGEDPTRMFTSHSEKRHVVNIKLFASLRGQSV